MEDSLKEILKRAKRAELEETVSYSMTRHSQKLDKRERKQLRT